MGFCSEDAALRFLGLMPLYEYSRAGDEMFAATHTEFAPWHVADDSDQYIPAEY